MEAPKNRFSAIALETLSLKLLSKCSRIIYTLRFLKQFRLKFSALITLKINVYKDWSYCTENILKVINSEFKLLKD